MACVYAAIALSYCFADIWAFPSALNFSAFAFSSAVGTAGVAGVVGTADDDVPPTFSLVFRNTSKTFCRVAG